MQSKDGGKSWFNVLGQPLQAPLTSGKNVALALDAKARQELVYIMDINYTKKGEPVILYLTSKHSATGPGGDPRTWRTLHFKASRKQWVENDLSTSTNNYDCGNLIITEEGDWVIIGPTGTGPQKLTTGGEMEMWRSTDEGKSWKKQVLTKRSQQNHTYAKRVYNYNEDFIAFWADGNANQSSDSSFYFCNAKGEVFMMPRVMRGATARPVKIR